MAARGFISVLNLYGLFWEMGNYAIVHQSEQHLTSSVLSDLLRARKMQTRSDDSWKWKNSIQDLITCTKISDECKHHLKHGLISDEESEPSWELLINVPPVISLSGKKKTVLSCSRRNSETLHKITRLFFKHTFRCFQRTNA